MQGVPLILAMSFLCAHAWGLDSGILSPPFEFGLSKHCKGLVNQSFYDFSILRNSPSNDSSVSVSSNQTIIYHLCNQSAYTCSNYSGYTAYLVQSDATCFPLTPLFSSFDSNYNISQVLSADSKPKGIRLSFESPSAYNSEKNYSLSFQILCDKSAGNSLQNVTSSQNESSFLIESFSGLGCAEYTGQTASAIYSEGKWLFSLFLLVFGGILCFMGQKSFKTLFGISLGGLVGLFSLFYLMGSFPSGFWGSSLVVLVSLLLAVAFGILLYFLEKPVFAVAFGWLGLLISSLFHAAFLGFLQNSNDSFVLSFNRF